MIFPTSREHGGIYVFLRGGKNPWSKSLGYLRSAGFSHTPGPRWKRWKHPGVCRSWEIIPRPSKGCQMVPLRVLKYHPLGFHWHPLEGAVICISHILNSICMECLPTFHLQKLWKKFEVLFMDKNQAITRFFMINISLFDRVLAPSQMVAWDFWNINSIFKRSTWWAPRILIYWSYKLYLPRFGFWGVSHHGMTGGFLDVYFFPRNHQRSDPLHGPEKTWVSNSATVVLSTCLGVRWGQVPLNLWWN